MPLSGASGGNQYFYPGVFGGAPPLGSGQAYAGRGPVDAYIANSSSLFLANSASLFATILNSASFVLSSSAVTVTALNALSGIIYSNSTSFVGDAYSVVFGPQDIQFWPNVAITIINNSSNNIKSGSVEWSTHDDTYETDWETTTFSNLTSSANAAASGSGKVRSMQVTGNSRRFLRVRCWPSGSGGALTGSVRVVVTVNDG